MIYLPCKDINEANAVLTLIGKCPYENVADMMSRFKASLEAQLTTPHTLIEEVLPPG